MKEIDFLPQWYKAGKRRRVNYRRQYIVIAGLLVTMIAWSLAAGYSVSVAKAQVDVLQESLERNGPVAARFQQFQQEITELERKKNVLEKLGQRTTVSSIIAELSYLVNDDIVVREIVITNEKFENRQSASGGGSVRISSSQGQKKESLLDTDSRIKVIIDGLAVNGLDVGGLMSEIENSPYFFQVVPGFSNNTKTKTGQATEFEISFYVANYKEQK